MNGIMFLVFLTPFIILAIDTCAPGFIDALVSVFTGNSVHK